MTETLDPEDAKIITLARSVRARNGSTEGAAVRDETGRTYAASGVDLPSLQLTAVQVAVAMAVTSGAKALEATALVTEADGPAEQDLSVMEDLHNGTLLLAGPDGSLKGRHV
ncbi:cytidine deaminase [Planotetraspora kaengkrachanensis]|uniref:Cytidine deaminase n=1 Tax=Planotetraspora kaengkrachanensis TaxID=575193 RepID=A0A8J3M491_9ACTN|nr:cytidine deaminase [Planotetraspora kaengkrachanensis]GIG79149.1 cytidine deaminase [Planotetraspora kaengkrachanensis]